MQTLLSPSASTPNSADTNNLTENVSKQIAPTSSLFTFLLGIVAGLPAMSIDLSAPTLALLPSALSTTVFVAGLSLSLFVVGFGLGQFAGGRGSDRFGRRPILLGALAIYTLAGVCCSFATSGGGLATARLLQGVGAGACSVQAYAIIQDLFVGEVARRKQAYVTAVLTLLPMVAPALGAICIMFFNWRLVHVALAVDGFLLLLVVSLCVAESRPSMPNATRGFGIAESVWILRDPGFRSIAAVNALSYASIFAYIAGAPVIIIAKFGYGNLAYAVVFAVTAAALSGGAMVSAKVAHRVGAGRLVWPALLGQGLANAGLVVVTVLSPAIELWLLMPLLMVGCFARGIIAPNLTYAAINTHRERAGLASALVGLAQLLTAAVASAVLARFLDEFSVISVAVAMAALATAAVLLWIATDTGKLIFKRT